MIDDRSALENFGGVTRLFPLPNIVLFPQVVQPLHIFEPRYRQLMENALAGDKLLTIVLLKPGWEPEYEACPAVHEIGCLGQIAADQKLPDGKFNILLRGLSRVRLLDELPDSHLYRSAKAELISDAPHEDVPQCRQLLVDACRGWLPNREPVVSQLNAVLKMKQPLGTLSDILAFALPLPSEVKQELLEAVDVESRVRRLIHALKTLPPPKIPSAMKFAAYPPVFSTN